MRIKNIDLQRTIDTIYVKLWWYSLYLVIKFYLFTSKTYKKWTSD